MERESNSLYTKTGFSKQGFSCCSRFASCKMGKEDCLYEGIDDEVKEHCSCYQRNHKTERPPSKENTKFQHRVEEYFFKQNEKVLVIACFNAERVQMGRKYLLAEKTVYKSTRQAYVYNTKDEFLGVYNIKDFHIVKKEVKSSLGGLSDELQNEKNIECGVEQLSLF